MADLRLELAAGCGSSHAARTVPIGTATTHLRDRSLNPTLTVTARDGEEAIKRASEEHDIPERERFRVSVQ